MGAGGDERRDGRMGRGGWSGIMVDNWEKHGKREENNGELQQRGVQRLEQDQI